jgi:hypothetical protein
METVYHGKPVIVLPFFADQFSNAALVVEAGIGHHLQKLAFTSHELSLLLKSTLEKAIESPTDTNLAGNVARLKKIAHLNQEPHRLLAANYIQMAATVGVEHLIPADVNLTIFDRYPIKLLVTLFVLILTFLVKAKKNAAQKVIKK